MPDNESNRSSNEWDQFADQIFKLIIDDLQSEDLQASSTWIEQYFDIITPMNSIVWPLAPFIVINCLKFPPIAER